MGSRIVRLKAILSALGEIAETSPVVLPLHPRTRKAVALNGFESLLKGVLLLEPLPYQDMMALLIGSKKVITDSGGLQKEAYFAGVQALVMMPDTAWIELVEAGWNVLVDAEKGKILKEALSEKKESESKAELIYGDGQAGQKIAEILTRQA